MPAREIRVVDSYELSPTQEGMLFHGLLGAATGIDVEQIVCTIRGPFDEEALVAAFHEVASRHAILRTRFGHDGEGRPVQKVVESVEIPVERLDLTRVESSDRPARLQVALGLDRVRGVDLGRAPAMRLLIVDWSADEHRVVWTFHHALLDGRSFPLVLREVFASYEAAITGQVLDLRSPRPYREYIEFLRGLDLAAAEAHWRCYLSGFTAPTPLVIDHPATDDGVTAVQGVSERRLPRETTAALREFASSRDVSLNNLLQAAWATLLQRYSGETDVVFGATRACRRSAFPDADEMVGLFINTLPLRVRVDPERTLDEFLRDVRAQQIGLREHEHTPLVKVQGWSEVPRGRGLFDSIVVYENSTLDTTLGPLSVRGSRVAFSYHGQTNYPLTLIAYGDDEMLIRIENDRRHVEDGATSRMLAHLVTLLTAMPEHGERKLEVLPLLTPAEQAALESAATTATFPADRCLHERFEEQARIAPERVAATCEGESLTYGALDRRANALAHELRSLGVSPGALVGLRSERSLDLVVGILGILKAGAAYLPLDPAYPKERVEFMLEDAQVRVVVTHSEFASDFEASASELVLLDRERPEHEQGPGVGVTPDDLAYVMYTSGSTGKPKGVLITHYNVTRLLDATSDWFHFTQDDVWTLFHSYAFDFSVWELWGALAYGGRLVVVPYWVSRSPEEFRELLEREGVSVLNQTPSAFRQLLQADLQTGPPALSALRYVVFGGEALELQSLRGWFERYGDRRPQLVNMYGITETTVHVTYRPLSLGDLAADAGSVIGVPIPDLKVKLLDQHGALVPIGVPGEMYVGGAGVSRGYLNRPELTAERFLVDPAAGAESRLYRTGDLARRLEGGDLEYLGRIDDQVKLRGFRIELGEIEAVLTEHPRVAECVVLVREDVASDKRLVAYVVCDQGGGVEELKTHVQAQLPEYMVPAHFVLLPTLPLTPNGKVDRKALPAPDYGREESRRPYIAPRTHTEETLAGIWATVLGAPRVSVEDNFFELGGDSILTIQIIARCRQAGLHFTPRDLAKAPSVAQLSQLIGSAVVAEVEAVSARGPMTPTPIQSWFFEQRFADPHHWNQAFLFEVPSSIDVDTLQEALGYVIARHEAFRLRVGGEWPAWTLAHGPRATAPAITRIDLMRVAPQDHAASIEAAAGVAQSQLDLHRGPLLAAVHFDRGADSGRLLLAIHHLVVDGVSWRLLIEDFETVYRALHAGRPPEPLPRSASFQRWSEALTDYAARADSGSTLARWLEIESVDGTLPDDGPGHGENSERLARTVTVSLDEEETESLLQRVPAAYRTQINDVLLTALALTLRTWSGRESHRIDLEGHGREEWIAAIDVSRTVGWFTTLYPVALDLGGAQAEGSALKTVKEALREVPDKGLSYGVLRYAADDPAVRKQLTKGRPADVLFNYLGQFDQVVAGSDLFAFADEPTGAWHGPTNERTHRLEVVALVRDGRLEVRWIHGAERDRPEVVQRLAHNFMSALRGLIEHCTEPGTAGYTPSDFPLARLDQDTLDRIAVRYPRLEDVYPLSPMQRLFLSMEAGGAGLGFEQWVLRLRGPVDAVALREAWESALARHAILRTAFVTDDVAEPLQVVERHAALPWAEEDWSARDEAETKAGLEALLRSDRERGFDVAAAPLTRVTLVRLADDEHQLVWSTHHLYVDGWSWPLVFRDVGTAYAARLGGAAPRLTAPSQYGAYIDWLGSAAPNSREFWTDDLDGFTTPTPLPYEAAIDDADAANVEVSTRLDAATTARLHGLARDLRVTLNVLIQGAWAVLLGHLSERDEVVFGAAFSGRPAELPGIENLVGPCVNNLPVRVRLDAGRGVSDLLQELHEHSQEIAQHQFASLSDIQDWAGVPWRLRLFDSLVVFQNYQVSEEGLRWGDVDVELESTPETTNYPLTLNVTPREEIDLKVIGQAHLFRPGSLTMILDDFAAVLHGLAGQSSSSVFDLQSLLSASTKGTAARAAGAAALRRQAAYVAPSDDVERAVAEVWEDLFQVEHVGVEDNFFDLGGHSILLLQAHTRLRERFGNDLSIVDLFQYPTVRSLARYLENGDRSNASFDAVRARASRQRQALARQRGRLQERR